jgi:hypothetical protein
MKLIIAGSRTINADSLLNGIILFLGLDTKISEVVSGTANGVDKSGEKWALEMQRLCGHMGPKISRFPAEWDTHGKVAGPIRNAQMADYADALLLIWDGESRGSANMKKQMEKRGKPIYEIVVKTPQS